MRKPVFKVAYKHEDEFYYYDLIRKNMRKFREEKGLTQEELADMSGLSHGYIRDLENLSKRRRVRIVTLGHIAEALGAKIGDMLEE